MERVRTATPLPPGLSGYVDALRLCAALVVMVWHLSGMGLASGALDGVHATRMGPDAVMLFFVLSGLVIGHVSERPGLGFGRFVFDRWTRLLSVGVPAYLFCMATYLALRGAGGPEVGAADLLSGLATVATFSTDWLGRDIDLPLLVPFWSVSYEAGYYLLFACLAFLSGPVRWLAAGALCAVLGPMVLGLLPVWLSGVLAWRLIARGRLPTGAAAWAAALGPVALYLLAKAMGWDRAGIGTGPAIFPPDWAWALPLGAAVALHLLGVAGLLGARAIPFARPIAWLAGGSFTLYLFHLPLISIGHALGLSWPWLIPAVPAACLVLSLAIERTLPAQRAALRRLGRALGGGRERAAHPQTGG